MSVSWPGPSEPEPEHGGTRDGQSDGSAGTTDGGHFYEGAGADDQKGAEEQ